MIPEAAMTFVTFRVACRVYHMMVVKENSLPCAGPMRRSWALGFQAQLFAEKGSAKFLRWLHQKQQRISRAAREFQSQL